MNKLLRETISVASYYCHGCHQEVDSLSPSFCCPRYKFGFVEEMKAESIKKSSTDAGSHRAVHPMHSSRAVDGTGTGNNSLRTQPSVSYYCHGCHQSVCSLTPTKCCPRCKSGFVEEMPSGSTFVPLNDAFNGKFLTSGSKAQELKTLTDGVLKSDAKSSISSAASKANLQSSSSSLSSKAANDSFNTKSLLLQYRHQIPSLPHGHHL